MAWYPTRISTRLTIGGILLLAVTTLVIVVIMPGVANRASLKSTPP